MRQQSDLEKDELHKQIRQLKVHGRLGAAQGKGTGE
jgi:hypothetical protein